MWKRLQVSYRVESSSTVIKNSGVNYELFVPNIHIFIMAKSKHLSGSKKRESRNKQPTLSSTTINGSIDSSVLNDNSSDDSHTKLGINVKLTESDNVLTTLEDSFTSNVSMVPPTPSLKTVNYDSYYMHNNKMGRFPRKDMNANLNMPVSQYYFLTQLMNQQKKVLEPDSINMKRNDTSTSNNLTCSTPNISQSTTLSSNPVTKKGKHSESINIDHENNNIPKIDDPKCQCHIMLDPYPSNLSLRLAPNLQHYCRVCNTQLNSCKQAQIHTDGKKHEKRLSYLKFSLETGLQNETSSNLPNQINVEQLKLTSNDMATGSNMHIFNSLNKKSAPLFDTEQPKKKKEASKSQHRSPSTSGTGNNVLKPNGLSHSVSNQPLQHPSALLNSSTLQNDGINLLPPLLPPMPPPPMLPSQLSVTSSSTVGTSGNNPFIPAYVQFPTSPPGSYYYQQPNSATSAIPTSSSAIYDKSPIAHSKSSSINEYQQSYVNPMPESSICGTVPNMSSSNAVIYQHPTSSSCSSQTEVTSISQQQASILSHQMIPPLFTPTMMNIQPVASVSSLSSINCNITDASASDINSSTPLSSVNYNITHQLNSSMPFQDPNQSFSVESNHGIPPQNHHIPTSFNSSQTICQNMNAIEASFYSTDGEMTYPYSDHPGKASYVKSNNEGQFKHIVHNGNTKIFKEKRGSNTSYKNNSKKFSMLMTVKHNRNGFNSSNSDAEIIGAIENSDGYTSSVSHSSARNSSQMLSSISGSNKMYKGNSSQQLLPTYQKPAPIKQKQYKCQSLDRSSDSDFTSQMSGTSKKKDLTSSMRTCDLCKLTFPSPSVLDNHLKGSKHTRKIKSQQAFRQLQDNGTNLRKNIIHEDGTFEDDLHFGEISCEVCEVSVNSSHQLQAHLAGHKHKVRCFRRGLHPSTAVLTPTRMIPSSSTPPSTAPSECSSTMPRSSTSFKYNPLSTSHYDTGTTTSSNNSYCQSNGTKSEGSRQGKKAAKTSLLGDPPPLHPCFLQNNVDVSKCTANSYNSNNDDKGDGLLPIPDNLKPLGLHSSVVTNSRGLFMDRNLFVGSNVLQQAIQYPFCVNVANPTNKHKSMKKGSRPTRNNTNAVRRYSTTESDDQIDSSKIKEQSSLSEQLKKETNSGLVEDASSKAKVNPSSIETNTSSFSPYNNMSTISLPKNRPETLNDDRPGENVFDTCNVDDCNISMISSKVEDKECSPDVSISSGTNINSTSTPISTKRNVLEVTDLAALDPLKSKAVHTSENPISPTSKQYPTLIGNQNNPKLQNGYKSSNKTTPPHSCDLCNVIVNSAAQLTQHMNSPRHHVKVADCKTREEQQKKEEQQKQQSDNSKLKEIPMLNMFLKTLQPPSTLPLQPTLQNSASTCNSSGNSQYFSSDKEGEGDSSSNTEVER